MIVKKVPWWWKYKPFSLKRKNIDVIEAQIKTLDSIYWVSKRDDLTGEETREVIERVISHMTKLLGKVESES